MITTSQLKRPPATEGVRLRHLTSAQVPKRTGGVFNFDKGQFAHVVQRPTNRVKGAMFSSDLRTIQEAKERRAKEIELAKRKATQEAALAKARTEGKATKPVATKTKVKPKARKAKAKK